MTAYRCLIFALIGALSLTASAANPCTNLSLANDLAADGNHAGAALEYRRLAMDATAPETKGALLWMAAYEYLAAERYPQADRMLGQVENATSTFETEVYLLRSRSHRLQHQLSEAAFYLESLSQPEAPPSVRTIATRQLAAVRVQMDDLDGARHVARALGPSGSHIPLAAIDTYAKGQDKSHVVGGLLGLVPGLGYAYSGEYGNAARSLILNALCLWGLVEFIEEDQWGGVAIVGFAEATFYSGSIYGGADAAVRYNRRRLRQCTEAIEGDAAVQPERTALPILTLRYTF